MKIKDIVNVLIKQYPLALQEEWDESGFLNKGYPNQDINKVFVCLDLNERIIDEAIKQKVKLIVSHHPIFRKSSKHELLSFYKKLIKKVVANKITVLSLHTCFDKSDMGMNFVVAEKLKLSNVKFYPNSFFVIGEFKKSLNVLQIANLFKQTFGLQIIKTNADNKRKFNKLAICGGAGLSLFAEKYDKLIKENFLLVTGDINHHGWQDLANYNLQAMDVGHDLENCFSDFIASYLKQNFPELDCLSITTKKKERII